MSRRIDIELTSSRDDGSWTWRAAGAKQPKGTLDGTLLPDGASTGDVLRADVETTLDGTEVLSVAAPKAKNRTEVERIEILGRTLRDDELVIETRAKRGRRDRGDREGRGDRERRGRRDGDRRRDGERSRDGDRRGGRRDGDRNERGGDRPDRGERNRGRGDRTDRPRRDRPAPPPKPKRLRAQRTHRKASLAALAPEEQVIAEQVLQGGIPAVRQAVDKMNEQAKAEGRPTVKPDALVAVAEKLLPGLRAAEWRDRAEAAVADLDELDLRDLRSVVNAADQAAKDDETRELAATIREGLNKRVDDEQSKWLAEIAENLTEGRTVRALRLSSRPPKAGAPLPGDLSTRLADAASAALTDDTPTDRWATVLDALSFSPVRLTVEPSSKPDQPSDELLAAITRVASRVPKVAEAFGIEAGPETPRRRGRGGGSGPRKGTKRPIPAPPADRGSVPTADASPETSSPVVSEADETTPDEAAPVEAAPEAPAADVATAPTEGQPSTAEDVKSDQEASEPADGVAPATEPASPESSANPAD